MYVIINGHKIETKDPQEMLSLVGNRKPVVLPKITNTKSHKGFRSRPWSYNEVRDLMLNMDAKPKVLKQILINRTTGAIAGLKSAIKLNKVDSNKLRNMVEQIRTEIAS